MEYIKLKDLCEKEERFVAPNDDAHIDYVDISSVDNKSKSLTKYDTYIFAEAPSRARKRVKHGDVIVSTVRPNLNAVARFNIQTPHTPIASTGFCVLRHKSDVDPIYIYFFCISPNFVRQMVAKATGASYPAVSDTIVREAKLPKHTAEKRVRIVSTLSKAKEIIEHRRAQLTKLDELVKCRFVEMFGDIELNYKLEDLCSLITDGTHQPPQFTDSGIPFLLVSNIKENYINYETYKFINEQTYRHLIKRTPVETGDLLLSTVGSYGHPAIVQGTQRFCFQRHIAFLKPIRERVNSVYLHQAILSDNVQEQIEKSVLGVAQKTLNLSAIRRLVIPYPPIEKQNSFASFVRRIDKLRFISGRKRVLRPSCTNELALTP